MAFPKNPTIGQVVGDRIYLDGENGFGWYINVAESSGTGDNDSDESFSRLILNRHEITWDSDHNTLAIQMNNQVTLQVGQEEHLYGKADGAISNGQVVMFAGAEGQHVNFSVADVNAEGFRNEWIIGVATQDFENNEFGYVTSFGFVRGVDTSDFSEGALLWLDPTTPGRLIDSEGGYEYPILVAAVTRVNKNNGDLFVRPSWTTKDTMDKINSLPDSDWVTNLLSDSDDYHKFFAELSAGSHGIPTTTETSNLSFTVNSTSWFITFDSDLINLREDSEIGQIRLTVQ